ncbi:unnamed protein product [Fraxinus pennsylvanica]|uniref:Protein WEAK CHLOROPLAST MOVEMENT UNDER BLUE LIGHT 1-like n=1 Tax=Fraxinus pennsylvanica TaxID=56036 RepID=A0AAD1YR61_9LAMI|nr:unnamed protein product [Fraxinus pennsylvanica]
MEANLDDTTLQSLDSCTINSPSIQPNDTSDGSIAPSGDLYILKPHKQENIESKIVARLSPEDDDIPTILSPKPIIAKVPMYSDKTPISTEHSRQPDNSVMNQGQIDTKAPFDSVKSAVSRFGGIVDWKAHHVQTKERRKFIEQELEKALEEIPLYKKQSEAAEDAKIQVLTELDSTKRLIEELKLNLERAFTEEEQAKQDSELAKLRVEELEKGIADEASFAAKAQLEVFRARHAAAASELKIVKDELEQLQKNYALLVAEKDAAVKKAEETISMSKKVEKSVEDLTIELITSKESLESAHAALLEAEEHRIGAVMAKEENTLYWEKELKRAEEELEKLNERILLAKDLKLKLDTASTLLEDLKAELTTYMELKLKQETEEGNLRDAPVRPERKTRDDVQVAVVSAKKELGEMKLSIEKAAAEVSCLHVASMALKLELEKEKSELAAIQQRDGMASIAVASLEAELSRTKSEIARVGMEKDEMEKMVELPEQLQEAAQEVDGARALAQMAREVLQRAKGEAEQAKAEASTVKSRLSAVLKEIEAAKASEKLASVAINALQESDLSENPPTGITLSLEEYYDLSKRAYEAEEQAKMRVDAAISQIEVAKESESRILNKLEEVNHEMAERKDALKTALQKSAIAERGKLGVEQELRKWRAELEQRRKSGESVAKQSRSPKTSSVGKMELQNIVVKSDASSLHQRSSPRAYTSSNAETDSSPDVKVTKKKKKSLLPRLFMFLGKKKSLASKKSM